MHRKSGQKTPILNPDLTNMRLLVLGRVSENGRHYHFSGFGFGWQGSIYYDAKKVTDLISAAMVSEGIDFEKSFFQLSERALTMLELSMDKEVPYLECMVSGLGSKGPRNLPSRKAMMSE